MRVYYVEHNNILAKAFNVIAQDRRFTDVKVDHLPGFTQPVKCCWEGQTEGMIPDLTARVDGGLHIVEVETPDSLALDDTAAQLRLFDATARANGGHAYLAIVSTAKNDAQALVNRLGLPNTSVWPIN